MSGIDVLDSIFSEAAEHLAAIEPILVAAEHQAPARPAVDVLFRSFHSLKGLARIASAGALEALMHQAETYLAGVRSGSWGFGPDGVEALLLALDAVRQAVEARDLAGLGEVTPLLARLEALAVANGAGEAGGGAEAGTQRDALGLEADMSCAFAELLQELLPSLASGLNGDITDDAEVLVHAASHIGLPGLAAAAAALEAAAPEARPAAFALVLQRAGAFATVTGQETGRAEALARLTAQGTTLGLAPAPDETDAAAPDDPARRAAETELAAYFAQMKIAARFVAAAPSPLTRRLLGDEGLYLLEILIELPDIDGMIGLAALPIVSGRAVGQGDTTALALLLAQGGDLPAYDGPTQHRTRLDGNTAPRYFAEPVAPSSTEEAQVRVPVEVLDKLFGRIGAFFSIGSRLNVLANDSSVSEALRRLSDFAVTRAPEILGDVESLIRDRRDFISVEAEIGHLISLIHESTLGLRVIPFETVVARFPRMVRETAKTLGKSVQFDSVTGAIKIDKGMADSLLDPMMHMLRNAIDHGIEPPAERTGAGKPPVARLSLRAEQLGNRLVLTIADDGRGINVAKVGEKAVAQRLVSPEDLARMSADQIARFIFTPGFSTQDKASDVSGRGVGMDVVLTNVTRLGGRIDIESVPGQGTSFRLDMPLSAAIRPMLLVDTGAQPLGFPESMVVEAAVFPASEVQSVNGQPALSLRGQFLPLFDLCPLLSLPQATARDLLAGAPGALLPVVICRWNGRRAGFVVQRILRRAELLIRETHHRIAELPGLGGVSILGVDRIVLVLDPDKLFALAGTASSRGLRSASPLSSATPLGSATPPEGER